MGGELGERKARVPTRTHSFSSITNLIVGGVHIVLRAEGEGVYVELGPLVGDRAALPVERRAVSVGFDKILTDFCTNRNDARQVGRLIERRKLRANPVGCPPECISRDPGQGSSSGWYALSGEGRRGQPSSMLPSQWLRWRQSRDQQCSQPPETPQPQPRRQSERQWGSIVRLGPSWWPGAHRQREPLQESQKERET